MPTELPPARQRGKWPSEDRQSLRLWIIVSALWTVATLFRVSRVWVPVEGWQAIVGGPWLWLTLLLPPVMFGLIILAVRQVADHQGSFHIRGR